MSLTRPVMSSCSAEQPCLSGLVAVLMSVCQAFHMQGLAPHPVVPQGIEYIELSGNPAAMAQWVGPGVEKLPLRWVEGPPALRAVAIKTAKGTVRIT